MALTEVATSHPEGAQVAMPMSDDRGPKQIRLGALRDGLEVRDAIDFQDVLIKGISADSREVREGFLFVAIEGNDDDGHDYIVPAVDHGAVAVVAEHSAVVPSGVPQLIVADGRKAAACLADRFYGSPSQALRVTAVTGTNGKTSTIHLVGSIFRAANEKVGLIGTIAYEIGKRRLPARVTTPGPIELQRLLRDMVDEGVDNAVMEASAHGLVQHRTHGTRLASGIFTNLAPEHLNDFGDMGTYRAAKSLLFESLAPEAFAVLNMDDSASFHFSGRTCANIIWYGLSEAADVRAEIGEVSLDRMHLKLILPTAKLSVVSRLIGRHNAYNILAAAANCWAVGVPADAIKAGIENLTGIRGRLERVLVEGSKRRVIVDYAHTDNALECVLTTLRPLVAGRLILVFGCGGDRDKEKRPRMGRVAGDKSDLFWITSDNPRSEDPEAIIEDVMAGVKNGASSRAHTEPDRAEAITEAIAEAGEEDVVLIAGKGHETTQTFKDTVIPFDDCAVAKQVLENCL